jgi:hypothetical protein
MALEAGRQEILVERSTRSLQRPARVSFQNSAALRRSKNSSRQPCGFGDMAKRLIAVLDGASVPFNREGLAPPFPAAQVRQEAARQWDPAVRPMRKDA